MIVGDKVLVRFDPHPLTDSSVARVSYEEGVIEKIMRNPSQELLFRVRFEDEDKYGVKCVASDWFPSNRVYGDQ